MTRVAPPRRHRGGRGLLGLQENGEGRGSVTAKLMNGPPRSPRFAALAGHLRARRGRKLEDPDRRATIRTDASTVETSVDIERERSDVAINVTNSTLEILSLATTGAKEIPKNSRVIYVDVDDDDSAAASARGGSGCSTCDCTTASPRGRSNSGDLGPRGRPELRDELFSIAVCSGCAVARGSSGEAPPLGSARPRLRLAWRCDRAWACNRCSPRAW